MGLGQSLLAATVFALPVVWFNNHELIMAETGFRAGLRCLLRPRINIGCTLLLAMLGGCAPVILTPQMWGCDAEEQLKLLFVYIWMITVAYYDGKTHRIPNAWILYGAAAWLLFWLAEGLRGHGWFGGLLDAAIGAATGGGLLIAGAVLKKGGIGMGDVKLYLVLGLLFGPQTVLWILLFSLTGAAFFGMIAMMFGKMGRGGRIPIGPFAYLGFVAAVLLGKTAGA